MHAYMPADVVNYCKVGPRLSGSPIIITLYGNIQLVLCAHALPSSPHESCASYYELTKRQRFEIITPGAETIRSDEE